MVWSTTLLTYDYLNLNFETCSMMLSGFLTFVWANLVNNLMKLVYIVKHPDSRETLSIY